MTRKEALATNAGLALSALEEAERSCTCGSIAGEKGEAGSALCVVARRGAMMGSPWKHDEARDEPRMDSTRVRTGRFRARGIDGDGEYVVRELARSG